MPFLLMDLDDLTRAQMLLELDDDVRAGQLYLSPRLSPVGIAAYPGLLRDAIQGGGPDSLAEALRGVGLLADHEFSRNPHGGADVRRRVPTNAAQLLAEGEFNRFYIRGLCRRVIESNSSGRVRVYRARESAHERSESEALIGQLVPAGELLRDLRQHVGVDTALRLPPGPNSGLSVRLP